MSRCGAALEQTGVMEEEAGPGGRHSVTPLWCAAVSGRVAVVRLLLKSALSLADSFSINNYLKVWC